MFITLCGKHGLKSKINVTGSANRVKKKNKKFTQSLPNYTRADVSVVGHRSNLICLSAGAVRFTRPSSGHISVL